MNAREKELLARHCLLHLEEVPAIWHQKQWEKLAVVVEYAQQGIPVGLSKTDPYMYRLLCAGLCEFHIRGYDGFGLANIVALAEGAPERELSFGSEIIRTIATDAV